MGRGVGRIVKRVWKMVGKPGKKHRRYVGIDAKGRWKFLKTPKGGSRSSPKGKGKTRSKRSNPRKSGGGRVARSKSLYRSMMKLAKAGALIAPAALRLMSTKSAKDKIKDIIMDYTGFNGYNGKWEPHRMARGWMPYVGVSVGEKVLAFVNRLLRSI